MRRRTPETPPMTALPLLPTPKEITAHLDRFVFGQDQAKRDLATAVYNHYLGLASRDSEGGGPNPFGPQHVLLLGPTGTGKSLLVRTLAGFLGVPFSFTSATSLAQTGYVGMHVEEMVRSLVKRAGGDPFMAERGIIFVDEFDKVRSQPRSDGGPDISGEGVQIGLLTLLDGTKVPLSAPGRHGEGGEVDTSRVLFVLAGAFVGLEEIVGRRLGGSESRVGFLRSGEDAGNPVAPRSHLRELEVEDLVAFGIIPELVGRLATWAVLEPFRAGDLVQILVKSENSILRRKVAFWKKHGIELEFTEGALLRIAQEALDMGTGARALNRFVERSLDDVDWRPVELMSQGIRRIIITEATVRREAPPDFVEGEAPLEKEGALQILRKQAFHPSTPGDDLEPTEEADITDAGEWTEEKIRAKIEEIKSGKLGWASTTGSARKWWQAFEDVNSHRLSLVLRLAEELAKRNASITEFFLAYVYSNAENVQANLHYLDYLRLKQKEEEKKRARRAAEAKKQKGKTNRDGKKDEKSKDDS